MAQITIVGHIGQDPELRFTPSGTATCRLSVAENQGKDKDGNDKPAIWHQVICWKELAENVSQSLGKGDRVIVSGKLDIRSYEKDGETKWTTEIVAWEVGPSLRWAQVKGVEKNEKTGGGSVRRDAPPLDGDEPF